MRTIAVTAAVVFAATTSGCARGAADKAVEWQGHRLREVTSLRELPISIQDTLGVTRSGTEGVADRGQRFNATDFIVEPLPMRRFLTAGHDGDTWLVALEHGGRGYSIEVFLFTGGNVGPARMWVLLDQPKELEDVVRGISGAAP